MSKSSSAHKSTKLENSAFTVITASDMEVPSFMIKCYIRNNADKDDRPFLVKIWNTIKQNNLKYIPMMLREALARESKEEKF